MKYIQNAFGINTEHILQGPKYKGQPVVFNGREGLEKPIITTIAEMI